MERRGRPTSWTLSRRGTERRIAHETAAGCSQFTLVGQFDVRIDYGSPRPGAGPNRLVEERIDGPTTSSALRGVLGGGAKFYVTEKAFLRTDGRWSFGRDRHTLAGRIGFGIDF